MLTMDANSYRKRRRMVILTLVKQLEQKAGPSLTLAVYLRC